MYFILIKKMYIFGKLNLPKISKLTFPVTFLTEPIRIATYPQSFHRAHKFCHKFISEKCWAAKVEKGAKLREQT